MMALKLAVTWLWWCAFFAVLAEVFLGNLGIICPVLAATCFYFAVTMGWNRAFIPFVIAATGLDVILGRVVPVTLLILPAAVVVGLIWRRQGECDRLLLQLVPASLLAVPAVPVYVVLGGLPPSRIALPSLSHGMLLGLRVAAGLLVAVPSVCFLLDRIGEKMDVPVYYAAQDDSRN